MASNLFHNNAAKNRKFSAEHAVFLCDNIRRVRDDVAQQVKAGEESGNPTYVDTGILVENLRELVEVIVWGDKHDESVFFVLLEQSVMLLFEEMVLGKHCPSEVKVQVIQCVTILLQNLTNVQSVFSVCSNNHINNMLQVEVNPDDEELQSNFVSFLKTLCLRLNKESVQFFFQQSRLQSPAAISPRPDGSDMDSSFPLFGKAVKLLASEEQMVRTAARQIVVTVLQLQDERVIGFLACVLDNVLDSLMMWICEQVRSISRRITKRQELNSVPHNITPAPWTTLGATDTLVEDLVDDLFYLNDLYAVPQEFVRPPLLSMVRSQLLTNTLVRALDAALVAEEGAVAQEPSACITPALSLLLLSHWFKVNEVQDFHELLVDACFGPSRRICRILQTPRLVQCHPTAIAVLQSFFLSKLSAEDVKVGIVRCGCRDGLGGVSSTDVQQEAESPLLYDSTLLDYATIRSTFGEYSVALQRGANYTLAPNLTPSCRRDDAESGECAVNGDALLSTSLLHVVGESICEQVKHSELIRLEGLQFSLIVLLGLTQQYGRQVGVGSTSMRDVWIRAVVAAQHSLVRRMETYRQHLWMMYGATGENSVLTPASLLCQLMRGNDREIADPLEVIFARLERDVAPILEAYGAPILRATVEWTTTKIGRDVALTCPLMPPLACWKVALVPFLAGDICNAERFVNQYLDMQQRAINNVPLHRRTPQDEDEVEYVEVAAWVLLRQVLFRCFLGEPEDPLLASLKKFEARRHSRDEVRAWELAASVSSPGVRCEFTPDHADTLPTGSDASHPLAPGSVLYMYVDGGDIFFVEPFKDPAKVNAGMIVFALRALYSEALIHNKQLFRLIVVQEAPQSSIRVSVVVRDRTVAQRVAQRVQGAAAASKHDAAALVWRFLMDDPLREHTNIFIENDG